MEADFPEREMRLPQRSSVVEIDGALVRLPDSANSGESGGDELSEVERILCADGHLHPGTDDLR